MKTAEEILREHCNITFSQKTGEEEVWSSISSVIMAMKEYAFQFCKSEENDHCVFIHTDGGVILYPCHDCMLAKKEAVYTVYNDLP